MRLTAFIRKSLVSSFTRVADQSGTEYFIFPIGPGIKPDIEKESSIKKSVENSDIILIQENLSGLSEQTVQFLNEKARKLPTINLGKKRSLSPESLVSPEMQEQINQYYVYGGAENLKNLLFYIQEQFTEQSPTFLHPINMPRQGIYHPEASSSFNSLDDYISWYKMADQDLVGILFDRSSWIEQNLEIENTLIKSFENKNIGVIPVFTDSYKSDELKSFGLEKIIQTFFIQDEIPKVSCIIKMISIVTDPSNPMDEERQPFNLCADLIKTVNIPVFQPIVTYYQSLEEWNDLKGLVDDVPWAVSMPEFEGVIEPVMIGSTFKKPGSDGTRISIPERCDRVTSRIARWNRLCSKPREERKIVFMLNNSPCHGVEATVGSASHMNGLQSVVNVLNRLKEEGYSVADIPEDGQELVKLILEKRALCEFRWTTVQDIVSKGGAIAQISPEEYNAWFNTLPEDFKNKVVSTWGEPPGEAMVFEEKILVTGVHFGNVLVCCQPKRGCYGPKCDGRVCKILHDPLCPPPHQYLATYHYLEEEHDADLLIHVGTHGSLELTPGKGVGMSGSCSPDVCIGNIPYLYIYNANNPPEGALAKRRTYATLIDYMLSVMDQSELYEKLEELDGLLQEYEDLQGNSARKHALEHLIRDSVYDINLENDMHLSPTDTFDVLKGKAHEVLSKIRNTQIIKDVHIFGNIPEDDMRVEFINNIIRFDIGDMCIRRVIAEIHGMDFDELFNHQDRFSESMGKSYGSIIEDLDKHAKSFIKNTLESPGTPFEIIFEKKLEKNHEDRLRLIQMRIIDINERLEQSKEIDSLLNGMDMGHTLPGPSGFLSRGQDDILPTGRNFYSTDPYRTPTKAAWVVGKNLAESLLQKFAHEEGRVPENVGFFWMAMDMMCSDGEGFAQMFHLIGVEPIWNPSGQVKSFRVVPLEDLGRPRIDITVEITSTLRDCYPNCYELLDEAINTVALLDEPVEMNFIRKHSLMSQEDDGVEWRDATLRIFSNPPGAYASGVALAVHASAWETEEDLVDIFMATHGYAYGKRYAGHLQPEQFARNLSTVDITYDKTASDSCDLLGCCCFFGNHGGMTVSARHFNPNEVKAYYGDTREPDHVYVHDMADEVRRVVRSKMLNPKWIEAMKKAGYNGAAAISTRTEHLMGWQASTGEIDGWIFDEITKSFVLNQEMKEFFEEKNPYAFEELTRRLLEANQRELWDADPEVLEGLKETYLEVESWLEEEVGEGEHQGGSVDIITSRDVDVWGESIQAIADKIDPKKVSRYLAVGRHH